MLGRTEPRTCDRMYCQTIRTVRDISRDDRSRIATCSLRTLTDRLKENYSIDKAHFSLHGRICISSAVQFIDETAHGLRGLHLESASGS